MNRSTERSENPDELEYRTFEGFLESVEKQAYVIALASCQNRQNALDIVQDAMLSMVKSYRDKPSAQWRQLFFKILNNRITDTHRKRGFGKLVRWFGESRENDESAPIAVEQLASSSADPETLADSLNINHEVGQALSGLSIQQQKVLIHRLWLGFSVKETADLMGISEGSVKTHLSRAVSEMRNQLEGYFSS